MPASVTTAFRSMLLACAVLIAAAEGPPVARAEEARPVALINFTARHVDAEVVQAFSRNLRETFVLDDRLEILDELAMYEALAGLEGAFKLKQARAQLAEAKKAYRARQFPVALEKLEAARVLHRELHSELSRPDELADLLLYQGLALFYSQRLELASVTFLQMFLLQPGIDVARAPSVTPTALAAIDEARAQERETPLKGLTPTFASEIAAKLQVRNLVTGVMQGGDGSTEVQITVQILAPGEKIPRATLMFSVEDLSGGAPPAGAAIYRRISGISERVLDNPRG